MDPTASTTTATAMTTRFKMCNIPKENVLFKWLLILWLLAGIALYLIDVFMFTSTIKDIFHLPSDIIFLFAICNNILLITSIGYELRGLLIASILINCALLVAIPALIVEVCPNLLTYASLMISIILTIVYGVLYMRNPLFYGEDPYNLPYNYLSIDGTSFRSRLSYNCPRSPASPTIHNLPINIGSNGGGNIPRHSCQF